MPLSRQHRHMEVSRQFDHTLLPRPYHPHRHVWVLIHKHEKLTAPVQIGPEEFGRPRHVRGRRLCVHFGC